MKKSVLRPLALVLGVGILLGSARATAYALNTSKTQTVSESKETASVNDSEKITKDETVYIIAGVDGTTKKIIVSDWTKNTIGAAEIRDTSELADAENIKGQETYMMNGDNMRVWDTQGNDIYYQGDIEKELPVNISITYILDGKTVSPDEIAGKSDHLTIRFDNKNNQYETVEIDGKNEKIYVPFAMLTGMMLDNDIFSNVDVSNGKLINDGDRIAVVGIAFPGLQSNLAIDKDKLDIPDYIEVEADVKNFEMTTTVMLATNEVFNSVDLDNLDSINSLTESLDKLTEAMSQLMDGSSQLYNGLCTLLDKSEELIAGIDKLATGAQELKKGAENLDNGVSQLQNGAASLAMGLDTLSDNNEALNSGAKQVFESLLQMADIQLAAAGLSVQKLTIENYSQVLNDLISSLDENAIYDTALQQVPSAVNAQRSNIQALVTEEVKKQVTAQVTEQVTAEVRKNVEQSVRENTDVFLSAVLANQSMTVDEYNSAIAAGLITEEMQTAVNNAVENAIRSKIDEQMGNESIKSQI